MAFAPKDQDVPKETGQLTHQQRLDLARAQRAQLRDKIIALRREGKDSQADELLQDTPALEAAINYYTKKANDDLGNIPARNPQQGSRNLARNPADLAAKNEKPDWQDQETRFQKLSEKLSRLGLGASSVTPDTARQLSKAENLRHLAPAAKSR